MSFLKKLKDHDPLKKVSKVYHHVRDEAIGERCQIRLTLSIALTIVDVRR